MKKYKCLCGGTAIMENITSLKTMISGKPIYRWRIVCGDCGTGLFDLGGSSTRAEAETKFIGAMRIAQSLAEEFDVTPRVLLKTVNS